MSFLLRGIPAERSVAWRLAHEARVRYVVLVATLAGAYYGAAQIGYTLKFTGAVAAIVWLPVGVGIAFLYLGGLNLWPGVVLGDLLANQYNALPVGSAVGQTIGNTLEVLVAAALLRRLVRNGRPLESVPGVCGLIVAIFAGVAVSATIGPISLRLGDVLTTSDLPHVWHTWWLGDTAGALVVVPFALAWWRPIDFRSWTPERTLEGALMLASVIGLTELALRGDRPLVYIVFPALAWGALRFGPRGGTLAVAVAVGFTLWKTAHHAGPFVVDSIPRSTLSTQLYVGVAALSTMFLAAVVSEREAFAKGLLESRARLVGIADRERRRLEHNLHDGAQLTLTMLAGQLSSARDKASRRPEVAPLLFDEAEKNLLVAIDQLRELAHGIHPTILTDLGLGEAIRSLTAGSPVPIQLLRASVRTPRPERRGNGLLRRRRGPHECPETCAGNDHHDPSRRVEPSPEDRRQRRRRRWSRRVARVGPAGPPRQGGSRRRNTSDAERRRTRYAGRGRHPSGTIPAGRLRLLDE